MRIWPRDVQSNELLVVKIVEHWFEMNFHELMENFSLKLCLETRFLVEKRKAIKNDENEMNKEKSKYLLMEFSRNKNEFSKEKDF